MTENLKWPYLKCFTHNAGAYYRVFKPFLFPLPHALICDKKCVLKSKVVLFNNITVFTEPLFARKVTKSNDI